MRKQAGIVTLGLLLSTGALPARAESAAAVMAAQAPTQRDQCRLLHELCHAAVLAMDRADVTPRSADVLVFSQTGKAGLAVADARDAARVIEGRNGGRLPCPEDPECAFLRPPPPRRQRGTR